jgi:hypothetical protein
MEAPLIWEDGVNVEAERPDATSLTAEWVDWWNQRRLHSAEGDLPPTEYEAL